MTTRMTTKAKCSATPVKSPSFAAITTGSTSFGLGTNPPTSPIMIHGLLLDPHLPPTPPRSDFDAIQGLEPWIRYASCPYHLNTYSASVLRGSSVGGLSCGVIGDVDFSLRETFPPQEPDLYVDPIETYHNLEGWDL